MKLDLTDKSGSVQKLLERMEAHLDETGWSEATFAGAVKSSNALFKNLRKGSMPAVERLHYILCEMGESLTIGDTSDIDEQQIAPAVEVDGSLFATVPRYNAHAAGGHGAINLDAEPVDRLAFTENWLKCQGINAAHCALITAKGDSMEPRIFEGDLIMIDRRKTTVRNHRVYVFNDGDRGTRVKRLELIRGMGLFLHSDNRENYPPESRIGHAANEIKVLGEVVWSGHKWS